MAAHDITAPALGNPVLFVVDADPQARAETESALARRFGTDYQVLSTDAPQGGLEALERLAAGGSDVALVAADLHLPGMDGVEFLERAHTLHPRAARVLLVAMDQNHTRLPFSELAALQRATALGRCDFWVAKGWANPEEWLYPQMQDALTGWTIANRPGHVVYRVVGEQWVPRSHELRDMLACNGVPFAFYAADSEAGQQLIEEFRLDVRRLPALIRHDGSVLQDPSFAEVAAAHGIVTRPSEEVYDLAIVGAGPAGLAAAVYGASEGLRTVVLELHAIGGQAGASSMIRNYLGFPRGISGGGLAHQAWEQAVLFGAEFVFVQEAVRLSRRGEDRLVELGDDSQAAARAVIVAAGAAYRRLGLLHQLGAVHLSGDAQSVPVNARRLGKGIGQVNHQRVADIRLDGGAGHLPVEPIPRHHVARRDLPFGLSRLKPHVHRLPGARYVRIHRSCPSFPPLSRIHRGCRLDGGLAPKPEITPDVGRSL
jgi:thioredoxin reductase (NADPH)